VEVVDAIFDAIVVLEGVEMLEEGFEELSDAIFHCFLLEDFVKDELGNEFDIAQDLFLLIF
jgi:hypothetical protein